MFVGAKGLGPGCHAPAFEPVAAADDCFEIRNVSTIFLDFCFPCRQRGERVGDQDTGVGTETVVIEDQVAEWGVLFQKCDERRLCVETESIIGKVDRVEILEG